MKYTKDEATVILRTFIRLGISDIMSVVELVGGINNTDGHVVSSVARRVSLEELSYLIDCVLLDYSRAEAKSLLYGAYDSKDIEKIKMVVETTPLNSQDIIALYYKRDTEIGHYLNGVYVSKMTAEIDIKEKQENKNKT